MAVAVGPNEDVWIAGGTMSPDFKTKNSLQSWIGGPRYFGLTELDADAFVAHLDEDSDTFDFVSFVGGNGFDWAEDIVATANGAVFVGHTDAQDFRQLSSTATSEDYGGGAADGFVVLLRQTTTGEAPYEVKFGSYIGGPGDDIAEAVAYDVDRDGIYIAGTTTTPSKPTLQFLLSGCHGKVRGDCGTDGQCNPDPNGLEGPASDAYVLKLSEDGTCAWLHYLGGARADRATDIEVHGYGDVYLVGQTYSRDYPVIAAFQPTKAGIINSQNPFEVLEESSDAFFTKIPFHSPELALSTYLGGSGKRAFDEEYATGVTIIGKQAVVVGQTTSTDYPQHSHPSAFPGHTALNPPANLDGTVHGFVTRLDLFVADLKLTDAETVPAAPVMDQLFAYHIDLQNDGPEAADNIVVTGTLSHALQMVDTADCKKKTA